MGAFQSTKIKTKIKNESGRKKLSRETVSKSKNQELKKFRTLLTHSRFQFQGGIASLGFSLGGLSLFGNF